jgi:lysophospholipase L1-like esterase
LAKDKRKSFKQNLKFDSSTPKNDTIAQNKRTPQWFYTVLVFIPIIFIISLELSLRIFNYGKDYTQWVEVTPGQLVLNPDIAFRYFHSTEGVPYSNQNSFFKDKPQNTFRLFIMGGSTAAGYPYSPNGDFGLYIKKKLEILYPEFNIEVVNIALTATNSYTIRDLLPGVIEQKPDLILLYAGHNEFYGAFGVGSMESIGQSHAVVNLILSLEKYKTFNLLRDVLQWIQTLFASNDSNKALKKGGTLMSRMVKDQTIALNSDVFSNGIEQFRENLDDILETCKQNKVPIIISTLTSNLKDQPPFVSLKAKGLPLANEIYTKAQNEIANNTEALKDYKFAKDLDGLRFRAPEKINEVIIELSKKYNCALVKADSIFNSNSTYGITGNSLMTDHLHPTFNGYKLLGKSFFEIMKQNNYLPNVQMKNINPDSLDIITNAEVYITKLDSIISKYRIMILKNDWPFSEPKSVTYMLKLFNQQNRIDSIAVKVLDNRLTWESAHRKAAEYYLAKQNYYEFTRELNVLINQYPFVKEYYSFGVEQLLSAKRFNDVYPFLIKGYKRFPQALYAKWIGIIDLSKENLDNAIFYLNESLKYAVNDPQVYYNLSGAYIKKKMYPESLTAINNCLSLNKNYLDAARLKAQLNQIISARR